MRTITLTAVITALALTGCTTPATSNARQSDTTAPTATTRRPPIAHLTAPTNPDTPVSDDDAEVSAYDLDDPADAAATLIIDALADEGLLVTSTDTQLLANDDRRTQVQVTVAHSPGQDHPTQSSYLLELDRDPDGWRIVTFSEPA
jgi:hypothetical protein